MKKSAPVSEYRTILYGNKVLVFTDHRNLTFNRLSSQRTLHWRLIAEEFNITLIFRPGASNLAADAVSRLPLQDAEEPTAITELEKKFYDTYFTLPIQSIITSHFPLQFNIIQQHQQKDSSLKQLTTSSPNQYKIRSLGDFQLLHYRKHVSDDWKIFLPSHSLHPPLTTITRILHHPGATRLHQSISKHFYCYSMRSAINSFIKTCDICQRFKGPFPRLGHLSVNQIDLVGPWTFQIPPKWSVSVLVLTWFLPPSIPSPASATLSPRKQNLITCSQ